MPYLGHREPDIADLGVSPASTAPAAPDSAVARAARLVDRVALDAADREMLLQALGLVESTAEVTLAG